MNQNEKSSVLKTDVVEWLGERYKNMNRFEGKKCSSATFREHFKRKIHAIVQYEREISSRLIYSLFFDIMILEKSLIIFVSAAFE